MIIYYWYPVCEGSESVGSQFMFFWWTRGWKYFCPLNLIITTWIGKKLRQGMWCLFKAESRIARARDVPRISLVQQFTSSNRTVTFFTLQRNLTAVSDHKTHKCIMASVKVEAWSWGDLKDHLRTLGLLRAVLITPEQVQAPHSTDIDTESQESCDSFYAVKLMCRKTTSWMFNSDDEWVLNGLILSSD